MTTPAARGPRYFGRFELRRLLGKSSHSMVWEVHDPRAGQLLVLALPRHQPPDAATLERWLADARAAARLLHPRLAPVLEIGQYDHWPYATHERGDGVTLAERLGTRGESGVDAARWAEQALEGLAYAHEAGVAHRDLQLHMLLLDRFEQVRVLGLAVGMPALPEGIAALHAQRLMAERDLVALGLVMHHQIAGRPALDEPDTARVIERLPPLGGEIVRLPWALPRPVPEALRAIVNRTVDRQPRQRYRAARTLGRALQGFLASARARDGEVHAQLLERVRRIGALPALPSSAARAAQLLALERQRTDEMARHMLRDPGLCFELLHRVNTAQVRGTQVAGNGAVLTVRRAIAMLGLEGVQRAAQALRPWPGPLSEAAAQALHEQLERALRAARVAQALRPPGYDAELVYLVTLLQNLGRLLLHYHFPEDAVQIRRLTLGQPAQRVGDPDEPGMEEDAAAQAVMGVDVQSMAAAVARQWGLDDPVLSMMRRVPSRQPVRSGGSDDEVLRLVASAACEAVEAQAQPARMALTSLERVAHRYARTLGLDLAMLREALETSMDEGLLDEEAVDETATPAQPDVAQDAPPAAA